MKKNFKFFLTIGTLFLFIIISFYTVIFYSIFYYPSSHFFLSNYYPTDVLFSKQLKANSCINLSDFCSEEFDSILITNKFYHLEDFGYNFSDDLNHSGEKIYFLYENKPVKFLYLNINPADENDNLSNYYSFFDEDRKSLSHFFITKEETNFKCSNINEKSNRLLLKFVTYYLNNE